MLCVVPVGLVVSHESVSKYSSEDIFFNENMNMTSVQKKLS